MSFVVVAAVAASPVVAVFFVGAAAAVVGVVAAASAAVISFAVASGWTFLRSAVAHAVIVGAVIVAMDSKIRCSFCLQTSL